MPSSVRYSSISDKLFLRRYQKAHPGLWIGIMAVFGVCNHVLLLEKSCLLEPVLLLKVSHLHKRAIASRSFTAGEACAGLEITIFISCASPEDLSAETCAAPENIPPAEACRSIPFA